MSISASSMNVKGPALEDLMCSVCLDILEEPVSFVCSHSLCNSCWTTLKETSGGGGGVSCPECRQVIARPAFVKVNSELWKLIQRRYSEELKNRSLGHLNDFNPMSPKSPRDLLREMREAKMSAEEKALQNQLRKDEAFARRLMLEEDEFEANEAQQRLERLERDAELARQLESEFEREANAAREAEERRRIQMRQDELLARTLFEEENAVRNNDNNYEAAINDEAANNGVRNNREAANDEEAANYGVHDNRFDNTVELSPVPAKRVKKAAAPKVAPAIKSQRKKPSKPEKKKATPAAEGAAQEAPIATTSKGLPVRRRTSPRLNQNPESTATTTSGASNLD